MVVGHLFALHARRAPPAARARGGIELLDDILAFFFFFLRLIVPPPGIRGRANLASGIVPAEVSGTVASSRERASECRERTGPP